MKRMTLEQFIIKARRIHKNKYDYSKSRYKFSKEKIKITCFKHGSFFQTPNSHLTGKGCPLCKIDRIKKSLSDTTRIFIKKAKRVHGKRYDYSNVAYKTTHEKVSLICPIHGEFFQSPANHLQGLHCKKCATKIIAKKGTYTTKEFLNKCQTIHKKRYDYSKVIYTSINKKIEVICRQHGSFFQVAHYHLSGNGCPSCNKSKGEIFIENWLKKNGVKFIPGFKFDQCKDKFKLPFDFYLPDYNACIEFDGYQHFFPSGFGSPSNSLSIFQRTKKHDKIKNKFCKNQGIKLLRISYKKFNSISNILHSFFARGLNFS